jgi:hypothetical protein
MMSLYGSQALAEGEARETGSVITSAFRLAAFGCRLGLFTDDVDKGAARFVGKMNLPACGLS